MKLRPEDDKPQYVGCEVCGEPPIIVETGMCGPCTYGTADAIGEGEYIEIE